jgi:hypothetical protein
MSTEPHAGDVRFSDSGDLEVFDGVSWGPYHLVPGQSGAVFRATYEPDADAGE